MDPIGSYEERPFLKTRRAHTDTLDHGSKKHHIPVLFEVDVTEARDSIQAIKDQTGVGVSFTGWVAKCIAQAVSEHRHVHAMRKGGRKLVVFQDVDVSIAVERHVPGASPSETLPMPYVIRKANEKTLKDIHQEVRAAQARSVETGEAYLGGSHPGWQTDLFFTLPKVLRDLFVWRRLLKDPFFAKKMMGTVMVTAAGMFGQGRGSAWGIPVGIHPLVVTLGSITRKPAVVEDSIRIRQILSVTLLFDHDVTDGAPVARFIDRLQELLETAFALDTSLIQNQPDPPKP